jgi:hypothetical protein
LLPQAKVLLLLLLPILPLLLLLLLVTLRTGLAQSGNGALKRVLMFPSLW